MPCLIPNCPNEAENNFSVRCRNANTNAHWAQNTNAYLCYEHAQGGLRITVSIEPVDTGEIETIVSAIGGGAVRRVTPIRNDPA